MLRVYYVSFFAFLLSFLICGACETWRVNPQQEKIIEKIEWRYDCQNVNIPIYRKIFEFTAHVFGFHYNAINEEEDCLRYKHVFEIPNPEYGKFFRPDFNKIYIISMLSTCGLLFYVFLFGNDWISQYGDYRVAAAGFRKVHVKKDRLNVYRVAAFILLGDEERYEELHPALREGTMERHSMFHGNKQIIGCPADNEPNSSYQRMEANFALRTEILEKFKVPIEIYKDSLTPVVVLSCPGNDHLEPIRINEEPTGFYSAIVPSTYTRITRFVFKYVCFPFHFLIERFQR